jgi:hypothetical protein
MGSVFHRALELAVVEAALCLLLASFFFERTAPQRKFFRWTFGVLAVLTIANYFNYGAFRGDGNHVHYHEQFHFYLGSKYLNELRYDAIYDAAVLASVDEGILEQPVHRRDPMDFLLWRGPVHPFREGEVRDRFTPERWQEFRGDVAYLFAEGRAKSKEVLRDHGNTGSPAWAMVASQFTRRLALDPTSTLALAYLDPILLSILFATVAWAFGGRTTALAMIVGLSAPTVFNFLGGSILRMDWLFALGMSVCFFEKRHFRTAGIFLGYAVASKLLAGIMVLPLGLYFLISAVRERRLDRDHLRYVLFAVLGLALFVVLAALYFADMSMWQDYGNRMVTTFQEHYYRANHSFRDLFLQAVHRTGSLWHPTPKIIAASNSQVFIDDVRIGFVAAQIVLLAGLLVVAVRNPLRVAYALGPLAVFVLLVTNRYYWQMWMISVLVLTPTYREDGRHTGFLAAILGWLVAGHLLGLSNLRRPYGGYFGSYTLFLIGAGLVGYELFAWYRQRRAASE